MKQELIDAVHEINSLRRENEILRAKVEVMEFFALVLHTKPQCFGILASPDIVQKLNETIQQIEKEELISTVLAA